MFADVKFDCELFAKCDNFTRKAALCAVLGGVMWAEVILFPALFCAPSGSGQAEGAGAAEVPSPPAETAAETQTAAVLWDDSREITLKTAEGMETLPLGEQLWGVEAAESCGE